MHACADRGCVTTMHPISFWRNSFDWPSSTGIRMVFIFGFWTLFSELMSGAVSWHSCRHWSYLESTHVGLLISRGNVQHKLAHYAFEETIIAAAMLCAPSSQHRLLVPTKVSWRWFQNISPGKICSRDVHQTKY